MGISPGLLQFGQFAPDVSDLNTGLSNDVTGCVPIANGYAPFPDLAAFTAMLPSPCRGAFFARNADGTVSVFAGTVNRLYQLSNTTLAWTDVSLGGVAYTSLTTTANWQFAQFNNFVIAVQVNTPPQVFTLLSSSAFANLGGSPPQAAYIAVINRFLVLAGITGHLTRVQWSGLNSITTWDNVTLQSNFQDLADSGRVVGIAGGDQFGVIFQDAAIRSMIFAPGSAVTFDILRIALNDGLFGPFAAVTSGDNIYFCSPQGFKVITPGGYPTAIGKERVDRTFFADVDSSNLQLLIAATDPTTTRVYWAYKSMAGSAGQYDKVLVYDHVLDKWTRLISSGQYITALSKPGLTLEDLDAISPGIISVTGAANNGSGAIRLTLSGLTAGTGPSNTNLNIENTVEVYGVNGTTEANGNWQFTIHSSSPAQIDLKGSTFTNVYGGGGSIGGALDQFGTVAPNLYPSLDDISLASLAQLAAIGTSGALGFFSGSNLEATIETPEQDGNGRRFFVHNIRPITDASAAVTSIATRDNAQATSVYTAETQVNDIGLCPVAGGGIDTRYAKVKLRIPYGSNWTFAQGIEPEFRMTGAR